MPSNDFARQFDERNHARFAARGLGAGTGRYTPPGGDADDTVDARVYINKGQAVVGNYDQQAIAAVQVQYFLADVTPAADGVLVLDGETWINQSETDNDGSLSTWDVRRG